MSANAVSCSCAPPQELERQLQETVDAHQEQLAALQDSHQQQLQQARQLRQQPDSAARPDQVSDPAPRRPGVRPACRAAVPELDLPGGGRTDSL